MMVTAIPVICLSLVACGGSNSDSKNQSPVAEAPTAGAQTQNILTWKSDKDYPYYRVIGISPNGLKTLIVANIKDKKYQLPVTLATKSFESFLIQGETDKQKIEDIIEIKNDLQWSDNVSTLSTLLSKNVTDIQSLGFTAAQATQQDNQATLVAYVENGKASVKLTNGFTTEQDTVAGETTQFGRNIVMNKEGTLAFVSDHASDEGVVKEAGQVRVFEIKNGSLTQKQKLVFSQAKEKSHFGQRLALSDDGKILFAAHQDGLAGFIQQNGQWEEVVRFGVSNEAGDLDISADGKTVAYHAECGITMYEWDYKIGNSSSSSSSSTSASTSNGPCNIVLGAQNKSIDGQKLEITASGYSFDLGSTHQYIKGQNIELQQDGKVIYVSDASENGKILVFSKFDDKKWKKETSITMKATDTFKLSKDAKFGYQFALYANGSALAVTAPGQANEGNAAVKGEVYFFFKQTNDWYYHSALPASAMNNAEEANGFGQSIWVDEQGKRMMVSSQASSQSESFYFDLNK